MSLLPNSLVARGFEAEQAFRENTIQELRMLATYINHHSDNCDFDVLKEALLKRTRKDQDYFDWLQPDLRSFPLGHNPAKDEVPYSIKTLHMRDIIKRTRDLLDDNLGILFYGMAPSGYQIDRENTTLLGEESTIWGNSKGTTLKTAFIEIALTMRDLALQASTKDQVFSRIDDLECLNLHTSHLVHQVPIPKGIYHQDSSFTSQIQSGFALTYTHSGYAYGGHRGESAYPNGKVGGPEDCSSFISKLTGSSLYTTTLDQQYLYQGTFERSFSPAIEWCQSPAGMSLGKVLKPLRIRDPQRDIKPGQIYTIRTTAQATHTGLVLGFESNGKNSKVRILSYNRAEPKTEGFGHNLAAYETTPARKVMFFDVNQE
ncbi:MAG: hypothetical protein KBF71_08570 [Alphaproteobacteria bacterium]|nr:hypothetical protein [Alphaproteobacteria bacterium]